MPNLKELSKKFFQKFETVRDIRPARMGLADGTLAVPGKKNIIWITYFDGSTSKVLNQRVPNSFGKLVIVGFDPVQFPDRRQVLGLWDVYPDAQWAGTPDHADTHTWGATDTVWIKGEQFLPALVVPVTGQLKVYIYPITLLGTTSWTIIKNRTEVDVSAHVPTSGYRYGLLVMTATGVITVRNGSTVDSRSALTDAKIPLPSPGDNVIAALVLYKSQTQLLKTSAIQDILDLRFSNTISVPITPDMGLSELNDVTITSAADKDIFRYNGTTHIWENTVLSIDAVSAARLSITNAAASTLALAITAGKTLTLTAVDNYSLTISGTSTINGSLVGSITGGGTIATGGFTLTVPATGTAALLGAANVFTASNTFDTTTLFVDATNHRVGAGTITPGAKVHVKGSSSLTTVGAANVLTADGTFTTSSGWTVGTGWTIGSGVATHATGTTGTLAGTATIAALSIYKVTFTVSVTTAGDGLSVSLGGRDSGTTITTAGAKTLYLVATNTNGIVFTPGPLGTFVGTIDDVVINLLTASTSDTIIEASDGTSTPIQIRTGASGSGNVSVGEFAGRYNISASGINNLFIGSGSGAFNATGNSNVAIGTAALQFNTSGNDNFAMGYHSLYTNNTGVRNIAVGSSSLTANTTGSYNIGIGFYALKANITGSSNTAIGDQVLSVCTTGYNNTAIGVSSLWGLTTGYKNVAIGEGAATATTDGYQNTTIGQNCFNGNVSGYNNVAVGQATGATTTGATYSTYLGYRAGLNAAQHKTPTNQTIIGNLAYGTLDNSVIIGNTSVLTVGIGTPTPTAHFHNVGVANSVQEKITAWSTQTANMIEIQKYDGTLVASIDGLGGAVFNATNAATTVQIGGATNNASFGSDGTLTLNGTATVFEDVQVNLANVKAPAANSPNWTAYRGCEVPAYSFSATNVLYFTLQLPHAWKDGSPIEPHFHAAYPNGNAGNSVWSLTYSWANIDGTFGAETTVTATFAAGGTTDKHVIHSFGALTATGKTGSSILLCSLSRLGGDAADTYASVIYTVSADFHVEKDKLGAPTAP